MSDFGIFSKKDCDIKFNISFYWIFICLFWARSVLAEYVRAVFMRLPLLNVANGYPALYAIYALTFALALPQLLKYQKGIKTLFPLIMALCYVATYFFFPQNKELLNQNIVTFMLTILPMVYLGFAWDTDRVINMLYVVSVLTIIFSVIYRIFIADAMSDVDAQFSGSMSFSYKMLPHVCLVGYYALIKSNLFNVIVFIFGTVFLFSLGTRGPLLCLFVFLLLVFVLLKKNKKTLLIISGLGIVAALLAKDYVYSMLLYFEDAFKSLGLSFRIVDKIFNGTLFESAGRVAIQSKLLDALENHTFWGYGLFGDQMITGTYAHNFVIELMVHFGVVIGVLLFILLFVLVVKKYFRCKNNDQKAFLLLLFCSSVVHLMVSESYLNSSWLFMLIGICLSNSKSSSSVDNCVK